jgi:hypothetical protein
MDIQIADIITLKKPHPCGNNRFLVIRSGMDIRIRCLDCTREVLVARTKLEKNIKTIEKPNGEILNLKK